MSKTELSLKEVISYELSPFPAAMLEARNVFRKAHKPPPASSIRDHSRDAMLDSALEMGCHVLSGGSLLHRMPWKAGRSYERVAQLCADFAVRHCGSSTMVVFDGYYEGPSIKDITHQRRRHSIHPLVSFTAEAEFYGKGFMSIAINRGRSGW